ncbi:O-antigen ligase family protein, partial [Patescibacteria group bacterium]|nr:O-antigen ligase family protein [Patescibacteria group bacterium]
MLLQSSLIILAAGFFLLLVMLDRRLALAAFVALLPVYLIRFTIPVAGLVLPSTLLEVMFWLLFLGWLVRRNRITNRPSQNWRPWTGGLILLGLGSLVGILFSAQPMAALGLWRAYFFEPILFFIMFVDLCRETYARRLVLAALGTTVAVVGIIAIIQKITGWWIPNPVWVPAEVRRVTAFYGYPNGIGLFAAPITILMTGWTVAAARAIHRRLDLLLPIATGLAALLGFLAILFAVSEGALIGTTIGLVVLGLLMRPLRPFALSAVIVGCLLVMTCAPLRNYASVMLSMRDDSWAVRKIVWTESLDMLSDRSVWGAGLAGYQSALVPYHQAKHIEIFMYPHNLFLNFWSEVGLIGLVGFLLLVAVFFRVTSDLAQAYPNEWLPLALMAAMVALLVHGL